MSHQLTKDPERLRRRGPPTPSSPEARFTTVFELVRYLDYCSEMLSLVGKTAALYAQHLNDSLVLSAVTEIEGLAYDMRLQQRRADHPGAALLVLHAIEGNHVLGTPFRVIDSIIPNLQHPPDMVSYSHWSTTFSITDSLNHIQDVTGRWRDEIFIGEVGRTEYPHASQYPYIYDRLSEAFEWGAHLGFMWNYRDEFQCIQGKNYGRWLRDCDDNLATSYGALKDLQRDYE